MAKNECELDEDKLEETALALLSLTLHNGGRAWKSIDWTLMDQLHEKGWISNPVGKSKSVWMTEGGQAKAREVLIRDFTKPSDSPSD